MGKITWKGPEEVEESGQSDLYRLQSADDMFIDKAAKSVLRGARTMVGCLRVLFAL